MNYKEISRVLNNKVNSADIIEVYRSNIDEISMLGQVVSLSSNLTMITNNYDFFDDGYKIIRNSDITEIVTSDKNDNLKFVSMIYRKEKLFLNHSECIIKDLKSWSSVFAALINAGVSVTVECNFEDAIDYYVGWITEIRNNIAVMRCFDGEGKLFKNSVSVNLDYVSAVTFGDRYTTVMSKYVSK